MVRLERDIAVIGTVNELLRQKQFPVFINSDIVFEYSRMMEARSGYAVVNGFSGKSISSLLHETSELFRYDLCKSYKRQKPTYRVLTGDSDCPQNIQSIRTFVGHMMDILDPAVNYPYDFLEAMRLIDVLESN